MLSFAMSRGFTLSILIRSVYWIPSSWAHFKYSVTTHVVAVFVVKCAATCISQRLGYNSLFAVTRCCPRSFSKRKFFLTWKPTLENLNVAGNRYINFRKFTNSILLLLFLACIALKSFYLPSLCWTIIKRTMHIGSPLASIKLGWFFTSPILTHSLILV